MDIYYQNSLSLAKGDTCRHFKALHNVVPNYVKYSLQVYKPSRTPRSSNASLLRLHEALSCADVYFVLRSHFTNSFYPKPTNSGNLPV